MSIASDFPAQLPRFVHYIKAWNPTRITDEVINIYPMLASGSDLRIMRGLVVVDSRFNLNLS